MTAAQASVDDGGPLPAGSVREFARAGQCFEPSNAQSGSIALLWDHPSRSTDRHRWS